MILRILFALTALLFVAHGPAACHAQPPAPSQPSDSSPITASSRSIVLDATKTDTAARQSSTTTNWEAEHDFAAARQSSSAESSPFRSRGADADDAGSSKPTLPLTTVFSSLAIVLGLFGALVWILKRSGGGAMSSVSKDTLQVLGRTPLAPRQNIVLVRCGKRILVLAVGGTNTSTLAEITDPDEINELLAGCSANGGRQQFLQTLHSMGQEKPTTKRFAGNDPDNKPNSLFANA